MGVVLILLVSVVERSQHGARERNISFEVQAVRINIFRLFTVDGRRAVRLSVHVLFGREGQRVCKWRIR